MIVNGRQLAPRLEEIREDHKARYRAAGVYLRERNARRVLDVGCGCGYGSFILASEFGLEVVGIDVDVEALSYGDQHYQHVKISRLKGQAVDTPEFGRFGAVVALEVIEHIEDAPAALAAFRATAPTLFGSVPNELVTPFDRKRHNFHVRHYTPSEIQAALTLAGWEVQLFGGQRGKTGRDAALVGDPANCATIVFAATA